MRLASIATFVTAAAIIIIGACNRTPTTPSVIGGGGQPPPPTGPFDVRLELIGPRTVAPGATAQLTAIMHRSDNTTQDLTSTATWRSQRTNVMTVSPTGLATGVALGDGFVQATANGRSATREIIVTPDGTLRLIGRVSESDNSTIPINGARVEMVGAPNVSTTTVFDGQYRLYGVSPNPQVRVTKDGYIPLVQTLAVTDHQTQNFGLSWAAPRPDIAGTYQLTITLADRCRQNYPEATFSRTYTAAVVQAGPALTITLTGATFALDRSGKGNRIGGRVEPGQVVISFGFYDHYYGYYADLVEEIEPNLYYVVTGPAVVTNPTANRLAGPLNGEILTLSSDPRTRPPAPSRICTAPDHQVVFSR